MLEINPSSNLRISGAGSEVSGHVDAGATQGWALTQLVGDFKSDLRFTIGTDDPGVFGTSIGSEYALLLECLLSANWRRRDAIGFIEHCRAVGLEAIS